MSRRFWPTAGSSEGVAHRLFAWPVLAAALAFAALFSGAPAARAHGENWELRILGQNLAGYGVTVRTAPRPPQLGPLQVDVQLIEPETLTYVGRATIVATARLLGDETVQAGPVISTYREPWHEMTLRLRKSGPWRVRLVIDGPRGKGETTFRIDVPGD